MRIIEPRLFVRDTCQLGEGPFWFERRLWWVDVDAGRLHSVDATGHDRVSYELGRCLGAAAPAGAGEFVVALEDGLGLFDLPSATVQVLASPEKNVPGNRFNDGKCDPVGRFVAGTLNRNGIRNSAALYSFTRKHGAQKILDPVSLSNGMAWSADGSTFYFIDTHTYEIAAFCYDLETGALSNRRPVVTIPSAMGLPDGMDIDAEGNLWVAHWDGFAVRCWSPTSGKCLAEVPVPCPCPTSCCFGGSDLDSLFITTARSGTPADDEDPESLAGSIFVCQPGVTGRPVRQFGHKL